MPKKSKVREAIDSVKNSVIIFLKGERKHEDRRKLYTPEERFELFNIKKDIERYEEHDYE